MGKENLNSIKSEQSEPPENADLFTIPEAAQVSRMSVPWWRSAVFQRRVRFVRLGRRILIPKSTINGLIERGTVEPREPRQAK